MELSYKGYEVLQLGNEELAAFYSGWPLAVDVKENEYVVLLDEGGEVAERLCFQEGRATPIKFKPCASKLMGTIRPRNLQQQLAFHLFQDSRSKVKFLTGGAGKGKDFIMIAHAIEALSKGKFDKIVFVRNNISVRNTTDIGALPGTATEKIFDYLMPFADHLGSQWALEEMIDKGQIEPIHLGFLRGRDLRNSLIYCMEAQNLTTDHMRLLISRVGEGSELWVNGDSVAQVDREAFARDNGLRNVIQILRGNPLFGHIQLEKSERSQVAALADLL